MAPSTFASAAAGNHNAQTPTRDAASEWSRRANGATQTFRRASGATTTSSVASPDPQAASQPGRYVPPHRNGAVPDTRYTKGQCLEAYTLHSSTLKDGLQSLYIAGWQPDTNGSSTPWARPDQNRSDAQPSAEVCWESDAHTSPLGLIEMDDEERDRFSSVNTMIKPANASKDAQGVNGPGGRKASISTTTPGYGLPSPSLARGQGRRRDTNESYPFPQNQPDQRAASPPPSLIRRRTDMKDQNRSDDREGDDKLTSSPFGSLKRNPTGGFAAPVSPWSTGPHSASLSPMGTFGNFGLGSAGQAGSTPSVQRPGLASGRTESRFKSLLNKDSEEGAPKSIERKASVSSLAKVNENEGRRHDHADLNDALDEADESTPAGSAALTADADISPPHHRQTYRGLGTPSRQSTQDEYGFGHFGMTSNLGFGQGRDSFQQTPAHQRAGLGAANEPMSPTDTNPYQSPEQHTTERSAEEGDVEGSEMHAGPLPGLGGFARDAHHLGGFNGLGAMRGTGAVGPASDRSQTSSVGPNRGFPSLSGLGQLGSVSSASAWPISQSGLGTPSRQTAGLSSAFAGGLFSNSISDLQSPGGLAGLGGTSLLSPAATFGSSRMASVFPQGMQDQMRQQDERDVSDRSGATPFAGLGDLGRPGDSGFKAPAFTDGQNDQSGEPSLGQFGALNQHSSQADTSQSLGQNQAIASSASNQPPAPQQRTMVMPDRMRWIYRDPQGQTQGPWSGLEMHDWYKAGFFSPELLVKKYEDSDYEPLAQLIRRIGNSREPFLVPQIGIPHGAPSGSGPNAWAGSGALAGSSATSAGGAQPPFASSFPSFGTTLTADQQNALERRKQEEQYLMARQKEHLAQAQMTQRYQMQSGHPLLPSQLHHHSSAHSLHSQPSFGSISSPIGAGYQASPLQGPVGGGLGSQAGFFDNSFRASQIGGSGAVGSSIDSLTQIQEEDIPGIMDRLNLSGGRPASNHFGAPGQPFGSQQQSSLSAQESHDKQVQQMLQDRARLQQEQAQHDDMQNDDDDDDVEEHDSTRRLKEFEQLQRGDQVLSKPIGSPATRAAQAQQSTFVQSKLSSPMRDSTLPKEHLEKDSISKQVTQQNLPQPFPAPVAAKAPLAAPEPQRPGRPIVAEHLQQKEPRDHSETPSVESKIAPWAQKDSADIALKGPSLKEIQEMEAKQAAKAEELAAAARRAALQKAMEAEAQAQAAASSAAPGLPAASNWATGSPATPTGASSSAAWAKATTKTTTPGAPAKSMAQIQKEEEARKRKLATALANAQAGLMPGVSPPVGGKSYATLAGKTGPIVSIPTGNAAAGAWTTVGASGKTKTPTTGTAPSPVAGRTVSSGTALPTAQTAGTVRKTPSRTSSTVMGAVSSAAGSATANAQEEFKKWAANELRPDLSKGISAEDFVSSLTMLPPETDILTEAVHGASSTLDSRHFAEEFLRRKKLADKGILDAATGAKGVSRSSPRNGAAAGEAKSMGGSGWSEVAKKGGAGTAKEEANGAANGMFRVVPAKKKSGKR